MLAAAARGTLRRAASAAAGPRVARMYAAAADTAEESSKAALDALMAESWKDGVYPAMHYKIDAAYKKAPEGETKDKLFAAMKSAEAVTDFGAIIDHFRTEVDEQTGGKFGDSTAKELSDEHAATLHLILERYEEYLGSFGEDEAELSKKVEQELGWSMLQLKQRVTGNLGTSWSAMPVFGTSGMAGSIVDKRSLGGQKAL